VPDPRPSHAGAGGDPIPASRAVKSSGSNHMETVKRRRPVGAHLDRRRDSPKRVVNLLARASAD